MYILDYIGITIAHSLLLAQSYSPRVYLEHSSPVTCGPDSPKSPSLSMINDLK